MNAPKIVPRSPLLTSEDIQLIWKRKLPVHKKLFTAARLMKSRSPADPGPAAFEAAGQLTAQFISSIPQMNNSEFTDPERAASTLEMQYRAVTKPTGVFEQWLAVCHETHPVARRFFHDRPIYRAICHFIEFALADSREFFIHQQTIADALSVPSYRVEHAIKSLRAENIISRTAAGRPGRSARYIRGDKWISKLADLPDWATELPKVTGVDSVDSVEGGLKVTGVDSVDREDSVDSVEEQRLQSLLDQEIAARSKKVTGEDGVDREDGEDTVDGESLREEDPVSAEGFSAEERRLLRLMESKRARAIAERSRALPEPFSTLAQPEETNRPS